MEFYSRASRVASDPRARELFLRLARAKAEAVRILDAELRGTAGAREPARGEGPGIYPWAAIEPLVCFVCGQEAGGGEPPGECPSCGASAYAFQVDIGWAAALGMALEGERRSLEVIAGAQRRIPDPGAREVLQRIADLERGILGELEAQRGKLGR